jgi:acetyl-CoA carboxylase biotin carboxylase subunit
MKINKLLIANRGEIAVRIMKTARRMGIRTVAIYSEVDIDSLHVQYADEAYCIGHSSLSDTYLNIPKVIAVAIESACDSVHPGYGFLAENPAFVAACMEAGLVFVGPDVNAMHIMGNKIEARKFADSIGVPVTKGITGSTDYLLEHAGDVGFPVLVKAAAGGGGKGMRIVRTKEELAEALESTSREAANYFADGTVYIEKFVENPRHIEFQLMGDTHGNVIHLYERECSIQRRYQKIIEEAPSPTLTAGVRQKMGDAAVRIGKAINYVSAGTIEFLVDANLDFYFLEMNTRIQVEHPVTEMTTGVDIVEAQLRIASGEPLQFKQEQISQHGHAIECRIYAEDPEQNFLPCPGAMNFYHEPSGEHVRVDSGITGNPVIQSYFDPMISKLIVWDANRDSARRGMIEALHDYVVHGIGNNIGYLLAILTHEVFIDNRITTKYCDDHSAILVKAMEEARQSIDPLIPVFSGLIGSLQATPQNTPAVWGKIGYWRASMQPQMVLGGKFYKIHLNQFTAHSLDLEIGGTTFNLSYRITPPGKLELRFGDSHYLSWISLPEPGKAYVTHTGYTFEALRADMLPVQPEFNTAEVSGSSDIGNIVSPMPGRVIKIAVSEGQAIQKGDLLVVVEAMKMENSIMSPGDGIVESIGVAVGDLVDGSTRLIHLVTEG